MASTVYFCGYNLALKGPPGSTDIADLPVLKGNGEFISCWKLSPEELEKVLKTGEVWISVMGQESMPPIFVSGMPMMQCHNTFTDEVVEYSTDGSHGIIMAKAYAHQLHEGQFYNGDIPYTYHLGEVVSILADLGFSWEYIAAAWLHDAAEDQMRDMSMQDRIRTIQGFFGETVALLVWCCTGQSEIDGVKQNRKARNAEQYAKIKELPQAANLKMADRIANMRACVRFKSPQAQMYLKESEDFYANVGVLAAEPLQALYHEAVDNIRALLQEV